jgi:hypothetical protein
MIVNNLINCGINMWEYELPNAFTVDSSQTILTEPTWRKGGML